MRILLIGINGVYNYGCEAIVRGTVNKLHHMFPDVVVDYASSRVKDDKRRLRGCDVNVIIRKNKWSLKNIARKLLKMLHVNNNICSENLKRIRNYDAVLSIGGDIYTILSGGSYAKDLVKYGDYCEAHSVPYILWGCSVGPFDENEKIKNIFIKHLSNISLIVAREYATIDYLFKIGVKNNVCFSFDPAFSVIDNLKIKQVLKVKVVGINLSPLSLAYLKMDEGKSIINFKDTIDYITNALHLKVILIPHVFANESVDDDRSFLLKIYESLDHKENVEIITQDLGFVGLKRIIQECDVVFAARMHCAINAITSGIPTYFLSYSEKSRGMSKLVYGNTDYCIRLEDFTKDGIDSYINRVPLMKFTYKLDNIENLKEKMYSLINNY